MQHVIKNVRNVRKNFVQNAPKILEQIFVKYAKKFFVMNVQKIFQLVIYAQKIFAKIVHQIAFAEIIIVIFVLWNVINVVEDVVINVHQNVYVKLQYFVIIA